MRIRGRPLLDKSVCLWENGSSKSDCGICLRDKCIRDNVNGISGAHQDFGTKIQRDVVGVLIPHVGDLLISGTDDFIANISGRLEMGAARKSPDGSGSI